MSDHPELDISVGFEHLVFGEDDEITSIDHLTRIAYNGSEFDVAFMLSESGQENYVMYEEFRILGARHANMLVCALLALLETYGQYNITNDQNMQEDYKQMVQTTKDAYAEKAFEQICNGLKAR